MTALPAPPGPAPLKMRLSLFAYASALRAARPLVRRYFARRAEKDPSYGAHLDERWQSGRDWAADVWVHAVSMGEMRSAEPLVRALLAGGARVLTTHMTPAGRRAAEDAFAAEIAADRLHVRYAPVDLPELWDAFHAAHRPRAALVMEMEFWPAMIDAAARAGCPLILANAQVPSRSFPRALRVARVAGHPVARAAGVFAKSDRMADRFRELGARHVAALGETRFDIAPPRHQIAAAGALPADRPVVTFASVVAGEEETFAEAARALLDAPDAPRILWVPRAPELFDRTVEMLRERGFAVARRSDVFDADLAPCAPLAADILVGDSLGEMFFYLAPARVVVVGGGFVPKGAHNVIEPLALGKPVIVGPQTWTIEYPAVEAEAAGVLRVVAADDLAAAIGDALGGDSADAAAFHAANAGASGRIAARVLAHLKETS